MPFILAGDVWEVRAYSTQGNQTAINRLRYYCTLQAGTGGSDTAWLALMAAAIPTPLKNVMSANASYVGLTVSRLHPSRTVPLVSTTGAGVGAKAGDPLPYQVSGISSLKSDSPIRAGRGRMFIPFPSEADNTTTGHPHPTLVGQYTTLMNSWVQTFVVGTPGVNASTMTPVIAGLPHGPNYPITAHTEPQKWATQRRRGDYGHANAAPF